MAYFLVVSSDYERVTCALYKNTEQIDQRSDHKHNISKNLIVLLDSLLTTHTLSLSDMDFIAVNKGPGPFTTLRTVIASVNGISFATHVPLIGINGLTALVKEHASTDGPITVALLNAFNKDVYFAIASNDQDIQTGYENIERLLTNLKTQFAEKEIRFIGSGVQLYDAEIKNIMGARAYVPKDYPLHASVGQIARIALEKWHAEDLSYQLQPLYVKEQKFKKARTY